jgi:lipoprotein-anchoring transpeptidase ErfK/SrfK
LRAMAAPVDTTAPSGGVPTEGGHPAADVGDDGPATTPAPTTPAPTTTALTAPSTPATAPVLVPEEHLDVGPDVVARVQRLLLARGIDVGDVDGALGERTSAGLAGFQREAGLVPTGAIDRATMARLEAASIDFVADMPASVVVDLSDQTATVANAAGAVIAVWPVSTGGAGSETPTGVFSVQSRVRVGEAKDAPTVHMDWFTTFDGDVGFHGIPWAGDRSNPLWTPLGQAAVSHGCVRMADANARLLYTFLPDGAPVVVQA